MKNSEMYRIAMDAVLDSQYNNDIRLAVIELLIDAKRVAEYTEKQEENKE